MEYHTIWLTQHHQWSCTDHWSKDRNFIPVQSHFIDIKVLLNREFTLAVCTSSVLFHCLLGVFSGAFTFLQHVLYKFVMFLFTKWLLDRVRQIYSECPEKFFASPLYHFWFLAVLQTLIPYFSFNLPLPFTLSTWNVLINKSKQVTFDWQRQVVCSHQRVYPIQKWYLSLVIFLRFWKTKEQDSGGNLWFTFLSLPHQILTHPAPVNQAGAASLLSNILTALA